MSDIKKAHNVKGQIFFQGLKISNYMIFFTNLGYYAVTSYSELASELARTTLGTYAIM